MSRALRWLISMKKLSADVVEDRKWAVAKIPAIVFDAV